MTRVPASIFRRYDIRGVVGDTLTPEIAHAVGRAYGSEAVASGNPRVVVGRDGRLSSAGLAEALVRGLTESGLGVIDIGEAPTPLTYFAAGHLGTESCISVTGSHNPGVYNGFKLVLGGRSLHDEQIQGLRARVEQGDLLSGRGHRETTDVREAYIGRVRDDVRLARPLRVGLDCGNGVGARLVPQLLETLGCEVVPLFCEVDGHFPNHHPNPSVPENLEPLQQTVVDQGLDLGLAFDGDADRLGIVDDRGKIIWPDRQLMLFARDLLPRHPDALIVYDVKCTHQLRRLIEGHGGRALMWKCGHSLLRAKMQETGALLGAELTGHFYFKDRWYDFDDAVYAATRLLEILSREPGPASAVFADLPESPSTPELVIPVGGEGQQFEFMRRFVESADFPDATLTTIDGLRADFPGGWALLRGSNTTPALIARFEADTEAELDRLRELFRARIRSLDAGLEIPF
ncbi:MAG: phosphomannomutase/phosphoglucomutase [Chromatiales bacterium]|jgi:phosphomannomutase/phosphoglucomutase